MAGEIHHFGTDENIIVFSILVILVPFITGIFLMGVRGLEIKRGKNYSERFSSIVGVGGLATSWIFSIMSQSIISEIILHLENTRK